MEPIEDLTHTDIAELLMSSPEFGELSSQMDYYCPFEALGIARYEIRHSNFLADLLAPDNNHGFGDKVLSEFLDLLLSESGDAEERLRLHLAELNRAEVRREWSDIDLVIIIPDTTPETIICVEIKVEATEAKGQLQKYQKIAQETWPDATRHFFFLTPSGIDPSQENWTAVSFATVADRLGKIVEEGLGEKQAIMLLDSYIYMMRRRYVPNEKLEKLAQQIWRKHRQTLEFLIDQKPDILGEASSFLQGNLFVDIANEVKAATGLKIELDRCSNTYIRIAVPDSDKDFPEIQESTWTESKRFLMCEIELYRNDVGIRMQLGPGESQARNKIIQALKDHGIIKIDKTVAKLWSRLDRKTLVSRSKIERARDENDSEGLASEIKPIVVKFLSDHLPKYDKAMKSLKRKIK